MGVMLIPRTLKVTLRLSFSFSQCRTVCSNLRVLYFGTDRFSLPSLKLLANQSLPRLEVVTSFKAKNNPVKSFADHNAIKAHDWAVFSKENNWELSKEFDIGLVVSFGHLIPEHIIKSFKNGMFNVHASLLPKYRGASPIIYAIRNGEKETGVSIMKIEPKKFDVGDVLAIRKTLIEDDEVMPVLHDKLSEMGAELLIECIQDLSRYQPIAQDNQEASYAPKVDNKFCKVRWHEMTSTEVFNLYRSIFSFKHILTSFKAETVKLFEIAKTNEKPTKSHQPGHLTFCKKSKKLLVCCSDDNFLEIKHLSIGRKKIMSAADFNNGFLKKCSESDHRFE